VNRPIAIGIILTLKKEKEERAENMKEKRWGLNTTAGACRILYYAL